MVLTQAIGIAMTYQSRYEYGFRGASVPDSVEIVLSLEQAEDLYVLIGHLSVTDGSIKPEDELTADDYKTFRKSTRNGGLCELYDTLSNVADYGQVEDPTAPKEEV